MKVRCNDEGIQYGQGCIGSNTFSGGRMAFMSSLTRGYIPTGRIRHLFKNIKYRDGVRKTKWPSAPQFFSTRFYKFPYTVGRLVEACRFISDNSKNKSLVMRHISSGLYLNRFYIHGDRVFLRRSRAPPDLISPLKNQIRGGRQYAKL